MKLGSSRKNNEWPRRATLVILLFCGLIGCSDGSGNEQPVLEGSRWTVQMIRQDSAETWVESQGAQEWWFFKSGVFRQISADYVEPQFYGSTQGCNGTATGVFVKSAPEAEGASFNIYTLTYEGLTQVSGLCRMTDRELHITVQPSGAVDLLDNRRVQRLVLIESIE